LNPEAGLESESETGPKQRKNMEKLGEKKIFFPLSFDIILSLFPSANLEEN
jgi:hypothetical protein